MLKKRRRLFQKTIAAGLALLLLASAFMIRAGATSAWPRGEIPHRVHSWYENIPVRVQNGDKRVSDCYLINETTYAPLRSLCDAVLPAAKIDFNAKTRTARVSADGLYLTAQEGSHYIVANGRYLYSDTPVLILDDGRTYIPIRSLAKALGVKPDAVAGHSLGEFSALVVAGALSFEDGLRLVSKRAMAMQKCCEQQPGGMAAVLGLDDKSVEDICASVDGVVVGANYNCPGQLVISGADAAVDEACVKLKEAGARRALRLPVGGAFHSPLMQPAAERLQTAIINTTFHTPACPIYQNVSARAERDKDIIQRQVMDQLTSPVRWTQSVQQMIADGATTFYEFGPGDVLKGLIRKISPEVEVG